MLQATEMCIHTKGIRQFYKEMAYLFQINIRTDICDIMYILFTIYISAATHLT